MYIFPPRMTISSVRNLKIKTRDGLDLGPFSTSEAGNVQLRGPRKHQCKMRTKYSIWPQSLRLLTQKRKQVKLILSFYKWDFHASRNSTIQWEAILKVWVSDSPQTQKMQSNSLCKVYSLQQGHLYFKHSLRNNKCLLSWIY